MRKYFLWAFLLFVFSGGFIRIQAHTPAGGSITTDQAERLASLPLKCLQKEYPNKLSQTLTDATELAGPGTLHPAFKGCFDWHSSVHGHWMLVKLLKMFPDLPSGEIIRQKLAENITAENIAVETAYFLKPHERSYERTYGWAWLLKLAEELHTWNDPLSRQLEANLQPLTDVIVQLYFDFLPKLVYPVRVGEHPNTAFGLSFAWDYAVTCGKDSLRMLIERRALQFFGTDAGCPLTWEPGGTDFLSPCLEEAGLMRRVLPKTGFAGWLNKFLPQLAEPEFSLKPARVSDRTDGKLVHLDGLNFSRARIMAELATALPGYDHLNAIAEQHIAFSLPSIVDGSYEGEHWLASFALLALTPGE